MRIECFEIQDIRYISIDPDRIVGYDVFWYSEKGRKNWIWSTTTLDYAKQLVNDELLLIHHLGGITKWGEWLKRRFVKEEHDKLIKELKCQQD